MKHKDWIKNLVNFKINLILIQTKRNSCLNQDLQDLRTRRILKRVSESGFSGFKDKEDFKRSGILNHVNPEINLILIQTIFNPDSDNT